MSKQAQSTLVTVDIVIPRLSPTSSGWEVVLIQRKKEPHKGLWALPGGHLNTEDPSLEAAAQREAKEETGLDIPLHFFQQVETLQDFEDPRGKYICLLYVLSQPLRPDVRIEAGDDASRVRWYSVENQHGLPELAFNHIKLLRMALTQFFTSYYHDALNLEKIDAAQCEAKEGSGVRCSNTAYWQYNGIAICPRHIQSIVNKQKFKTAYYLPEEQSMA